jgi:toxin ParE1/3/4
VFALLSDNPRIARLRNELSPPLRIHPFKAHLIIYVVDGDDDSYVLRVRHGHEDWLGELS